MLGIVLLAQFWSDLQHLHPDDTQTLVFNSRNNPPNQTSLHTIWLHKYQSSLKRHFKNL
jgi:hypothetical protein